MVSITRIKDLQKDQKALYKHFQENALQPSMSILWKTFQKLAQANKDKEDFLRAEFNYAFWERERANIVGLTLINKADLPKQAIHKRKAYFDAYDGDWVRIEFTSWRTDVIKESFLPDFMFRDNLNTVQVAQFTRKVVHLTRMKWANNTYLSFKRMTPTADVLRKKIAKLEKELTELKEKEALLAEHPGEHELHPEYLALSELVARKPFSV